MAYRCRNYKLCGNVYTEVAGGEGWGSKGSGADCLPCYYAGLMRWLGHKTPEDIEAAPEFMAMFLPHLAAGGWTWADVKRSYEAKVTLK